MINIFIKMLSEKYGAKCLYKMFSNTRWSVVGLKTRSHKMTPVAEVVVVVTRCPHNPRLTLIFWIHDFSSLKFYLLS